MAQEITEKLGNNVSDVEREILSAIKNVRYGVVEVIIHDSKVVQIERTEKLRLTKDGR